MICCLPKAVGDGVLSLRWLLPPGGGGKEFKWREKRGSVAKIAAHEAKQLGSRGRWTNWRVVVVCSPSPMQSALTIGNCSGIIHELVKARRP